VHSSMQLFTPPKFHFTVKYQEDIFPYDWKYVVFLYHYTFLYFTYLIDLLSAWLCQIYGKPGFFSNSSFNIFAQHSTFYNMKMLFYFYALQLQNQADWYSGHDLDSSSGEFRFEFRSRHWLFWGFLWFPSVPSGKSWETPSIRSWPLPSKSFPIQHPSYHFIRYILHTGSILKTPQNKPSQI
jgi:hypothetical protein